MPDSLCVVSGTILAPAGSPLADATVTFHPAPAAARSNGQSIVMPQPVSATPDAAGRITVELAPGVYSVRTRQKSGLEYDAYLVEVPGSATAELTDIRVHLPSPLSIYDAAASAHRAALAAGEAVAALEQINGAAGIDLAELSELLSSVQEFIPDGGTDGDMLTLVEGSPAWTPAPTAGVSSVNGESGAVTLTAAGLGAATAAQGALAETALQPGSPIPWTDVTGRPTAFTPAEHGHDLSDIAGLQAALDGKAALSHGHSVSQITDFPALAEVATSGAYADLSGAPGLFGAATAGLVPAPGTGSPDRFLRADGSWTEPPGGSGGGVVAWTDVTGKPTTFAPAPHGHPISEITALQTALDAKAASVHTHTVAQISDFPALGGAAVLNVGTEPGTVAAGDHGHATATGSTPGFLSAADKAKLDGIAAGAQPGTVTSVGVSGANGISVSGSPITGAGSFTLGLTFGTAANTVCQGNDARLTNSREWTAETVTQAEAEAGTAATRRAWTAQRVRQAVTAWASGAFKTVGGESILGSGDIPVVGTGSGEWNAETVPQAEAEAGTATTRRAWTAERVRQATAAWWTSAAHVVTARIADAAVTNAKLASMAAQTVKGRGSGTGAPSDLAIGNDAVLGRAGSGNLGALSAGNNGVLRREGSGNLGFGLLALSNLSGAAVDALRDRSTHTGLQDIGTVNGLQVALDSKASAAALDEISSGLMAEKANRIWFDATLAATDPRPTVDGPVRWPSGLDPQVSITGGVIQPRLSGPPPAASSIDTFDAVADVFEVTLTANVDLGNLAKANGDALDSVDRFRTGIFIFTQDATGGREVEVPSAGHYVLVGRDYGAGNTLPIDPAGGAKTIVYFTIISPTRVDLVVALPGAPE